jgi:dolichyl-phosphate-mannose--protein O-mannosyl transferase
MNGFFRKYFLPHALCLIVILLTFYIILSEIHFAILRDPGNGDVFIISDFRHTLDGKGWMLPMYVTIISLSIPFFGRDG